MEETSGPEHDLDLENARRVLRRSRSGRGSETLQIGVLLTELDSWLADDRQWRRGEPTHWRSLADDVLDRLRTLEALSSTPVQQVLHYHADELDRLKKDFRKNTDPPDDALRRQLRRISAAVRTEVTKPELLVMAWRRIIYWTGTDPRRAEDGVAVLRDLADLNGHDPDDLFSRIDRILADNAWEIAGISGGEVPDHPHARAGETADARRGLAETALTGSPHRCCGVVWLEYLQAELRYPWTLSLGPHVTLYQHDFLRSIVHQAPDDARIPDDLRQGNGDDRDFDLIWFNAHDPEKAVQADHEVPGDPRVFLRLQLPEMPPTQLLAEARETAEFLVAFGALASDNHDLWILSDSYLVREWKVSTSYMVVSPERARDQLPSDLTAMQLARHADELGRPLPLRTTELRMAGRLLVWLRQAGASDNPAKVVLCDRVIEQVCGWAGIARPPRFTETSLKPEWIYNRIWNSILRSYRLLRFSPLGPNDLWKEIEPPEPEPPHAPRNYLGPTNLKAILENIDELAKLGEGLDQGVAIQRLRERVADRESVRAWLTELGEEFDKRNARLRRTRNALMHGGPITVDTVNHVSEFSMSLAYLAIGAAANLLLKDRNLIDGFLDNRDEIARCFARLREGAPMSEVLWKGSV